MKPDGSFDTASLHSGCPVITSEKWSATKWIHVDSFDPPFRDPDVCQPKDAKTSFVGGGVGEAIEVVDTGYFNDVFVAVIAFAYGVLREIRWW
ncbi:unnamed protein product [Closterium sp. NIES-54]